MICTRICSILYFILISHHIICPHRTGASLRSFPKPPPRVGKEVPKAEASPRPAVWGGGRSPAL